MSIHTDPLWQEAIEKMRLAPLCERDCACEQGLDGEPSCEDCQRADTQSELHAAFPVLCELIAQRIEAKAAVNERGDPLWFWEAPAFVRQLKEAP